MQKMIKLSTFATLSLALGLAACGGSNAPSIDQVKEDFNSPSGSTKDKQSVAQAYSKQSSSDAATKIVGGGFVPGGLSTTPKGFERLQPRRMFAPVLAYLDARAKGAKISSLRSAESYGDCFSMEELIDPNSFSGDETGGSFSGSATKDLSTCTAGEVTGQLTIDFEGEFEVASNTYTFTLEYGLENVCEQNTTEKTCANGNFTMEMSSVAGKNTFTSSWFMDAKWTEDGAEKSIQTKGGMRYLQTDSTYELQYLVYVKDASGTEVSLVLSIKVNGEGTVEMHVKGSDGEINCLVKADGTGSCDGDLAWDDAYVDGLEANEELATY